MNKNIVMFKGKRDGISVILDAQATFEDLKTVLVDKVGEASRFFGDSSSAITFSGRVLSEKEEDELLEIIASHSNLVITFIMNEHQRQAVLSKSDNVTSTPSNNTIQEDIQNKIKESLSSMVALGDISSFQSSPDGLVDPKNSFDITEHTTKFQQGSLRSGQIIRYRGSVVVLGDVNPGAEILAEGNVIVLGSLKGLVHAGCMGNDKCFICALSLTPSQLRIADKITYMPAENKNAWGDSPKYAFISDGQIYIAPLIDN